jgi:hypothetical protein
MDEQNFGNHTRWVPAFHFFVVPVLLINFGMQLYWWGRLRFVPIHFLPVLVSAALLVGFVAARTMALAVQDRVIRLEERLRYERVLPAELLSRSGDLDVGQIVALRFASDAELAALLQRVLDEKLTKRKAIKQLVKNWRPDYLRA